MALISRVSRLFRADLHAVLDRIEEPQALLREAVREMEHALARDERRVEELAREHRLLGMRMAELDGTLADIEQELDVCFDAGEDELARAIVKRKLENEQLRNALGRRRDGLEETLSELKTRVLEQRSRLESIRSQAEITDAEVCPDVSPDVWAMPESTVRDEDVDVAFLREKRNRAQP